VRFFALIKNLTVCKSVCFFWHLRVIQILAEVRSFMVEKGNVFVGNFIERTSPKTCLKSTPKFPPPSTNPSQKTFHVFQMLCFS
jgi:hypothetical protein